MHSWIALLALLASLLLAGAQHNCPATHTVIETKIVNVTISSSGNYTSPILRNVVKTQDIHIPDLGTGAAESWLAASLGDDTETRVRALTTIQDVGTNVPPIGQPVATNNLITSDGGIEDAVSTRSDLEADLLTLPSMKNRSSQQQQSTLSCDGAVLTTSLHTRTRTLVHYLLTLVVVNVVSENASSTANGTLATAPKNWTGAFIPLISSSSAGSIESESITLPSAAHVLTNSTSTSVSTTHDQTLTGHEKSMPLMDSAQARSTLDNLTSLTGETPSLRPTIIVTSICRSWQGYNYTQIAVFTLPPSTTLLETSLKPADTAKATYSLTLTDDRIDATYTFPLPNEATPCPAIALPLGWDMTCGEGHNHQVCPGMLCCGPSQLCGSSKDYCKQGCRKQYGLCWHDNDDHGPAAIGGFIGGAVTGSFGMGCLGICGIELPTPKNPSCVFPAGCPPGKGGDAGGGADNNDGNDQTGNDNTQDHDESDEHGETHDGHGQDHNDKIDNCGESNKHPATFYRIYCVQYVNDSSNTLYSTCTKTETSTSEVCTTGSDYTTTEWTTRHCSTTATATVTSAGCAEFTFTGTGESVTTTRSCTTAMKKVIGCEVTPSVTTSYWTCSPSQTVTDYTDYCNHSSGSAGSKEAMCTQTIGRVVSSCTVEPTATSVFPSCSFDNAVSPDDDYGMESKCKKAITSTVTDVEASCLISFIGSGAYTSTVSSCTATETLVRSGACITATTTSRYITFSACPAPHVTRKVLSAGQQCARPQITITPVETSSCPIPTMSVDPDDDQGQCGEDEESCPYDSDVVLSPDDDQGEEGGDAMTCPYIPGLTLSPNDEQGENGQQNGTSFSTSITNCVESCTGPHDERLGACSFWQQELTRGNLTQGCACESTLTGVPLPEPVVTCGNLKCPNELNTRYGCLTATTGPCTNLGIPQIGPCTREKHLWSEGSTFTSSDRCHCPLDVSKHRSATTICNVPVCPNEVEVVYRMDSEQWTVTRAAQVPTEDNSECSPTNTALGDCLELDVLWLDSTITSCSCLSQQGREVWPIRACDKTVCPNQIGSTTFVPRYAPTFTQHGCTAIVSEGLAPCTKRIWSSWTSTWRAENPKRAIPLIFRHGSYDEVEFTSTDCVCSWFWGDDHRKLSAEPVCGTLMCPNQVAVKYGTSVAGLFSLFPSAHWSLTSAEPQVSQTLSFPSATSVLLSPSSETSVIAADEDDYSMPVNKRGIGSASPQSGVQHSLMTSPGALDSMVLRSASKCAEDITARQSLHTEEQAGKVLTVCSSTPAEKQMQRRSWMAKLGQWHWGHALR